MPKRLHWTPELIDRFWDGVAEVDSMEALSFATLAGPAVLELMLPWISVDARCLDFGAGNGDLAKLLMDAGRSVAVEETSGRRAETMARRLGEHSRFLGTVSSDSHEQFDFVLCTEVIEHVPVTATDAFMRALVRRIRPGGLLFLTTPHQEALDQADVYCPVCDHVFHRWQHMRSWRLSELHRLMSNYNLTPDWIGLASFDADSIHQIRDFHLRLRLEEPWPWQEAIDEITKVHRIGRGTNIVYVGRCIQKKPQSKSEIMHAGIEEAKKLGSTAIAVVPPGLKHTDAPIVVVSTRLGEWEGQGRFGFTLGAPTAGRQCVVFPGDLDNCMSAINAGEVPNTQELIFYERSKWRIALPVKSDRQLQVLRPTRRRRVVSLPSKLFSASRNRLVDKKWARKLQPFLDNDHRAISATLKAPGNFPHRLSRVVAERVVVAIGSLNSGGAERQAVNLAQGLTEAGHDDVHLLVEHLNAAPENRFYLDKALNVAKVHAPEYRNHGIHPWAMEHEAFRRVLSDGMIDRVLSVAETIKALSPEVVCASLDWTNITAGLAAVLAGVPHVFLSGRNVGPANFEFFQWFMYPCYRALLDCGNVHMLNNSEAGRTDYATWLRVPERAVTVVRNGLQPCAFPLAKPGDRSQARRTLGLSDDAKVIVGAFRLSEEKRPLLWIDAAAHIRQRFPEVKFLLCGVGKMLDSARSYAKDRGLEDAIQFLGQRRDIHTVLSASDLVIQASLYEGTPNTLIEAQAMGIPVVTTPAFGAAEAVADGATGIVVRDETPEGLAAAAVTILSDADLSKRMGDAGPCFVMERFGYDRMINEMLLTFHNHGVEWAHKRIAPEYRFADRSQIDTWTREEGLCFVASIPQLASLADCAENPLRSPLVVFEDDKELGPAHAPHATIRNQGGGSYSHWGEKLYFSTSDGTDPRIGGRRCEIAIRRW